MNVYDGICRSMFVLLRRTRVETKEFSLNYKLWIVPSAQNQLNGAYINHVVGLGTNLRILF